MKLMTDRYMKNFINEYQSIEWILIGIMPSEDEVRKKFGLKPALTTKEILGFAVCESD